jgi:elongation factor P
MMYETSDVRKGLKVKINDQPCIVVDFQFVKPGKGNAFTTIRTKSLTTGQVLERNYKTGEKLEPVTLDVQNVSFMYADGDDFHFMNNETFDQFSCTREQLGDSAQWLLENMKLELQFYDGKPIAVELPTFVELRVTYTEPAVKGNTATGASKTAELETGAKVQVPLFVNDGELLRIDTRTGEYVERVNK